MNGNTRVWITLVALSVTGLAAREALQLGALTATVLGAAAAKCTLVGWQFMELRAAHIAWRIATLALVAATITTVATLLLTTPN